ncbi:MAG: hypothetical protein U0353_02145 [Sandaracinus sp.]
MLVLVTVAVAGCPDTHSTVDAGTDAAVAPDAWGDAGPSDAAPPICAIEGHPVAAVDGSSAGLASCACPDGLIPGIGIAAPAPLAVEHGPFALCIPPRTASRIIAGLCGGGQVVHLYQGRRSTEQGVDFVDELRDGDGCMDAAACLFAERQLPGAMRPGCVYPDYTIAETGIIPPTGDCETLRGEGLCSIDCPCASGGDFADCFGLSETQPIGVCADPPYCDPGAVLCWPGQTCVIFWTEPEFAQDMESAVHGGRCVPPESCAGFQARVGADWLCVPSS